jgi:hypothetical protein
MLAASSSMSFVCPLPYSVFTVVGEGGWLYSLPTGFALTFGRFVFVDFPELCLQLALTCD